MRIVSVCSLILFAIIGVFSALSLKHLKTQYSVMQFLPTHHPALAMDERVRKKFNLVDRPVFVGVIENEHEHFWFEPKNIERLKRLTHEIEEMPGVQSVLTLANVEGANADAQSINIGKIMDVIPAKQWSEHISSDHLLSPNLVTADGRTAVVYAVLESGDVDLLLAFLPHLRQTLHAYFQESKTSVGGVPAVQTDLGVLLNKELVNFLVLTLFACALTLICIFRNWSALVITVFLTAFSNLVAFAMMAHTGLAFTVLSSTIPILVFIAVVSICVHVLLRTEEELTHETSKGGILSHWQIVLRANKAVAIPNFLGAGTTCVGFLTLLTSDVPMIREYGIGTSGAIMLAWLFTSLGIIPLQLMTKPPRSRAWVTRPARWALWIVANRRRVAASIGTMAVVAVIFGHKLQWTARLFDELPSAQEARRTTEKIDSTLGGVVPLELTVDLPNDSDWNDPQNLSRLDGFLNKIRRLPSVGSALSIPDFLRSSGIYKNSLPQSRAAAAEMYALYSFSADNPLTRFVSGDNKTARVQIRVHDLPATRELASVEEIKADARAAFPGAEIGAGGMAAIAHIIHHEISNDLIFGFWQALLVIVILLTIVFRSLRWSLAAAIPNLLPPVLLMAYLVVMNIPVKPSVAIIFSIALGLAFNNTVYALNRLRSLQKSKSELPVYRAFYLEGTPCMLSSLVFLMGFAVFLFSYFHLNQIFGQCMLIAILAGMLGDLVLLPALLRLFPKFLTFSLARKSPATEAATQPIISDEL